MVNLLPTRLHNLVRSVLVVRLYFVGNKSSVWSAEPQMAMEQNNPNKEEAKRALTFIMDAPYDEEIVAMDCNDYCEQLAELAERVAGGESLDDLLPEWQEHMKYWSDCREEFDALVAVLKAEQAAELEDALAAEDDPGKGDAS